MPVCRVHVCTCVRLIILVLVCGIMYHIRKDCLGFSVGYQRAPGTSEEKKNAWYQRALRCQLRGRPFHPWAGRLRSSGEAHPGPATLTQSSSFSCGAGLQSESRVLLCCTPAVYMLAADAAVAAAVSGLEHLISYCNKKNVLVLVWGTSERLVPAKTKQNAWYQRALRCQMRGRPSTRGQGDSASLVKPTQDRRR